MNYEKAKRARKSSEEWQNEINEIAMMNREMIMKSSLYLIYQNYFGSIFTIIHHTFADSVAL